MTENLQCALTGKLLTREKTIRFVIGPDNTVIADLSEELPGEGIRLLGYRGTLEASIRDGSFKELFDKKWLDGDPVISASFLDKIESQLMDKVLGLIGLARRAGSVLNGFAKVEGSLKSGKCKILLTASDGAEDGRMKMTRLAEAVECQQVTILPSARLSMALGQTNVIHAGIIGSGWAERLNASIDRLSLYVNGHEAA
jgi:ribosomal protein L7Ae-like RNA K-turn-binding protein